MKRLAQKAVRPPIDHAVDRDRWADLIRQAHRAVAEDSPDARARLAERAVTARNVWTPPVPYPESLLCLAFAQAAYGWARQMQPDLRAAAAPVLIAAAGAADQVMACAPALDLMRAEAAARAAARPAVPARLPYADA